MIYPVEFKVSGITFYYEEFFKKFAEENDDFSLSSAELKEEYSDGDKVFKYTYNFNNVELVPEPTNEHDPNAIRVEADGFLLGYIEKNKTARVKELLSDPSFRYIKLEVGGGEYKHIYEDEDEKLKIEKDESGPFAVVSIYLEKAFEPSSAPVNTTKEPSKLGSVLFILGIIDAVLSLVMLLLSPVAGVIILLLAVYLIIMGSKLKKKRKLYEESLK